MRSQQGASDVAEIERLREKIDVLREDNRQLREHIGMIDRLPDPDRLRILGISNTGYKILAILAKRKLVQRDFLASYLWNDGNEPEDAEGGIAVQLTRLRKLLAPYGIQIKNIRGVGWYFDDESSARANDLIKEMTL